MPERRLEIFILRYLLNREMACEGKVGDARLQMRKTYVIEEAERILELVPH